MTSFGNLKVFFEPKVERHDPALYAHVGEAVSMEPSVALAGEAGQRFVEQGFILVKGLLSEAELEVARAELSVLTTSDRPRCEMIWFEGSLRNHLALSEEDDGDMDGKSANSGFTLGQSSRQLPRLDPAFRASYVRKLMGFVGFNPALGALAAHPDIIRLAASLFGASPRLFQEMALIKPPGGREKPWHQDQAYFNLPLDTPVLGVWMPFGKATPANGCMHVLKGAHRLGPRPHFKRRDWQICDTDVETEQRLAVPMEAGDVLFFDGKLPHGTPINETDEQRWAVQFHYCPETAIQVDDAERLNAFGNEGKNVTC
ncbi:MAG: phytanoyl-CoA dioxygenase family protein [Geminicoccaceae bacterium]